MLNNNRVSEFSDIEALGSCASLTHLSLIDNPITLKPEYRLFVISRLPNLRMLDFRKIKLQERKDAKAKYSGTGSSTFVPGEMANSSASDFTREQIDKIRDAIKNATTAEAVQKY